MCRSLHLRVELSYSVGVPVKGGAAVGGGAT
jgi:hypothetical protein